MAQDLCPVNANGQSVGLFIYVQCQESILCEQNIEYGKEATLVSLAPDLFKLGSKHGVHQNIVYLKDPYLMANVIAHESIEARNYSMEVIGINDWTAVSGLVYLLEKSWFNYARLL